MPTYEYRCTRCHHEFEVVHAVGETVERCERCKGPVRRVFSVPALIFKGSGFYVTDNRKIPTQADGESKAPAPAKASSSGSDTGSSSSSTTPSSTASSSGDGKKAS